MIYNSKVDSRDECCDNKRETDRFDTLPDPLFRLFAHLFSGFQLAYAIYGLLHDAKMVLIGLGVLICRPLEGVVILPRSDNVRLGGYPSYLPEDLKLHGVFKTLAVIPKYYVDDIALFRSVGHYYLLPLVLVLFFRDRRPTGL
jgi:hypothetical protein